MNERPVHGPVLVLQTASQARGPDELQRQVRIDHTMLREQLKALRVGLRHFGVKVGNDVGINALSPRECAAGEPGDLRFTITAAPTDRGLSRLWFVHPEPEYTQDFVGDYRKMDLATAMDAVLSDRVVGLNQSVVKHGGDITERLRNMPAAAQAMPDGMRVMDVSSNMAQERLQQVNRRHPVYRSALQLVVNALCYITAYPDDIISVWPEGTPVSLKHKASSGQSKEALRAKSKLAALGYVPVHVCGRRIDEQRDRIGIAASAHGHVAAHWRRGHWRNQAHGPLRSLRKLIWVMPVLVGAHRDDEPGTGHLYLVS